MSIIYRFSYLFIPKPTAMKLTLTMLVSLLATLHISAQQQYTSIPEFGKVDISELKMKDCPFEPNAPAMVIFSEARSILKFGDFMSQTEYHYRIKIFNKEGLNYANIKLRYPLSQRFVGIKKLEAQTYNLDDAGNIVVTKMDKGSVYEKKESARMAQKIFSMPAVKEGSVIEYKYTMDNLTSSAWYFQDRIPVKLSHAIVDIPAEFVVAPVENVTLPMKKGESAEQNNKIYWFEMENIPALPEEPYMSCAKDYLQRVEIRPVAYESTTRPRMSLIPQWPEMIKTLLKMGEFGEQLNKDLPRTADLDEKLKSVTDPYQRMHIIHQYVRENMIWNNYISIWAIDGVKSAWKDKKGTSGEINLILLALLRDAGLKAKPILVSTMENGLVNTAYADIDQFDKVMAYVEIGDKVYILDAVEKSTPSYLIPPEVIATEGLLIVNPDSNEWGWKTLWDADHKNSREVQITGDIDTKGMIKGSAEIKYSDYAKVDFLPIYKKGEQAEKEKLVSSQNITIDSIAVAKLNDEMSPIIQTVKFSMPATSSGDYNYFSVNLFAGLDKNPLIADNRQSDIFYGANQDYTIDAVFILPDGYKMDDLPQNVKMITPDTSIIFSRRASYSNGMLSVMIKLEFKSPLYPVTDYDVYKEFYKKMYGMLNDKFVYKKG